MSAGRKQVRGLTWGHRRAVAPLEASIGAFARQRPDIEVSWAMRSLADFEHQPLSETVRAYDLIIFDHPFIGTVASSGLFQPLDEIMAQVEGALDPASYAGPSLNTYRWNNHIWGAPIDAATMNAIYRADLLDKIAAAVPHSWDDVLRLGREARKAGYWLGLANGDHHGFLTVGTLMHNAGHGWTATPEGGLTFDMDAFAAALDALREVTALAHPDSNGWNSIRLHDAMSSRDDVVYCPMTYGYATYGEADHGARRLRFAGSAARYAPYESGTLIGGAGVGLSAFAGEPEAAKAYIAFLLDAEVQTSIFAGHHGQPARIEGWQSAPIDTRFNGYFSGVLPTMESAAVRPRFAGYGIFEKKAGQLVNALLAQTLSLPAMMESMQRLVTETQTKLNRAA